MRHLSTVIADTSGQGKTNGNLKYSSITMRKYLFALLVGRGPFEIDVDFFERLGDLDEGNSFRAVVLRFAFIANTVLACYFPYFVKRIK